MNTIRRGWAFLRRCMRTAKRLATSRDLPVWLRVMFVVGCVQIPVLPVDEIALLIAVAVMAIFYRAPLLEAWASTDDDERRIAREARDAGIR